MPQQLSRNRNAYGRRSRGGKPDSWLAMGGEVRRGCGAHCSCFRVSMVTKQILRAGKLITRLPIHRFSTFPAWQTEVDEKATDKLRGKSKRREPQSNSKRRLPRQQGLRTVSASTPNPPIQGFRPPQAYLANIETLQVQHHTTSCTPSQGLVGGGGHYPVTARSSQRGSREQAL